MRNETKVETQEKNHHKQKIATSGHPAVGAAACTVVGRHGFRQLINGGKDESSSSHY